MFKAEYTCRAVLAGLVLLLEVCRLGGVSRDPL
jgi:hypothetical protein